MTKRAPLKLFFSYLWITLASVVYAVGFNWCYEPNQIGFGGITGVAQIVNAILPAAPIGTVVIILNVPLFLMGWKFLGGHLLLSSLYAMFISSLAIDLLHLVCVFQPMDPVLATIYGGVLMGGSLGVIFLQGATTGGTDLIARLLKLKLAWLPMGKLLMAIDLAVILAVAVAFGNLDSALYGVVALYLSSKVMDLVLYGLDTAKVAYIISDRHQEIAQRLIRDLDRGVTLLRGEGGWSGREKRVVMCAFKQRQIVAMKAIVRDIDPAAFLIVCDAHEVMGEGFREYKQNDL
ncbi:MAG TPA: YitT family protein [Candidatus Intestinimonas stercoravium]|uniref:YitT family protein n=1 Tax=uncultured Intestinimonas sp. TaxID=1689265 RepID=UPI001F8D7078|nr:YitT family protein [uncultured Intestinimonas sp.]HJA62819.1 YitT family protein [Candidatus Intestinimonas stercoravium]